MSEASIGEENVVGLSHSGANELTAARSADSKGVVGKTIVSVSPFRCRVWDLHDRMEDYVTEESCKEEIESFRAHGQLVPALGRPLRGDRNHDIEIVYGARRLFVARHLGVQLQVELREMSDREALIAMDIENRHRKDTSPYERGLTYQRWLRAKIFSAQDDIARLLKISPSQVSRLLKLAQLPSVIVNAFASPIELREGWGLELSRAWQDETFRPIMAQRARALAVQRPRPSAVEVHRRLLSPSGGLARTKRRHRDEIVLDSGGRPLFRMRRGQNTIVFVFSSATLPAHAALKMRDTIVKTLQDASS